MVGEASVWVQGRRDTLEVRPDPSLPQGDYRQLVHELDEAEYRDIRLMVMEIRNAYTVLYIIILKNFESPKAQNPREEMKGMIY